MKYFISLWGKQAHDIQKNIESVKTEILKLDKQAEFFCGERILALAGADVAVFREPKEVREDAK